jgi:hypothetical protein
MMIVFHNLANQHICVVDIPKRPRSRATPKTYIMYVRDEENTKTLCYARMDLPD